MLLLSYELCATFHIHTIGHNIYYEFIELKLSQGRRKLLLSGCAIYIFASTSVDWFSQFFFLLKACFNYKFVIKWVRNCAPCIPSSTAPVIHINLEILQLFKYLSNATNTDSLLFKDFILWEDCHQLSDFFIRSRIVPLKWFNSA